MVKAARQGLNRITAFSVIELLIAIVVLGVLAAITLPSYSKLIEKNKGKNAVANLLVIYNAQKRYRLDNGNYYVCVNCNAAMINAALGVHIDDPYFIYEIKDVNSIGYKVIARRAEQGICGNNTMELTDAGTNITKGCRGIW